MIKLLCDEIIQNLNCNKLTFNSDKTILISFDKNRSASNLNVVSNNTVYNPGIVCKYLSVQVDTNLSFQK